MTRYAVRSRESAFSRSLDLTMLEARLENAALLKKLLDAIKDAVTDANFDCSESGIALQAMDSAHVSLVAIFNYR